MSVEHHISPIDYAESRQPDEQYKELLDRIRRLGDAATSGMDQGSREVLGHTMRFDLTQGVPIITERDLTRGSSQTIIDFYEPDLSHRPVSGPIKQALGEIIGFMNGARTQDELESYGCKFWAPWTSNEAKAIKRDLELGDLGPGSYGAAFHDFPTSEGRKFNQYANLVEQIKSRPELRTHIITPFIPQYISRAPNEQQKVLIVPCHGLQHFNVNPEQGTISLVHWQRSADVPIGLPFNMLHYPAVLMMVAQVTGYRPEEYIHQISNAHYYDQHRHVVDELLSRSAYAFPKLKLDPTIKNIEDFRVEHFSIEDYQAHSPISMGGTAV